MCIRDSSTECTGHFIDWTGVWTLVSSGTVSSHSYSMMQLHVAASHLVLCFVMLLCHCSPVENNVVGSRGGRCSKRHYDIRGICGVSERIRVGCALDHCH